MSAKCQEVLKELNDATLFRHRQHFYIQPFCLHRHSTDGHANLDDDCDGGGSESSGVLTMKYGITAGVNMLIRQLRRR